MGEIARLSRELKEAQIEIAGLKKLMERMAKREARCIEKERLSRAEIHKKKNYWKDRCESAEIRLEEEGI